MSMFYVKIGSKSVMSINSKHWTYSDVKDYFDRAKLKCQEFSFYVKGSTERVTYIIIFGDKEEGEMQFLMTDNEAITPVYTEMILIKIKEENQFSSEGRVEKQWFLDLGNRAVEISEAELKGIERWYEKKQETNGVFIMDLSRLVYFIGEEKMNCK